MRRAVPLLALLVFPAWTAAAGGTGPGKVLIHCTPTVAAQVDPIKSYGQTSSHLHLAAGANLTASGTQIFSSTTKPADLTATGSTATCNALGGEGLVSDHDLLWIPQPMNANGTPAAVGVIDYYIANNPGYTVSRAPNGLRFVGGNPSYRGAYNGTVIYQCDGPNGHFIAHTIPPASSGCTGYEAIIYGPGQCFYGPNLGEGMGSSNPAAKLTSDTAATCSAGGGTQVPQIQLDVQVNGGVGGYLSSDVGNGSQTLYPGDTAHFDFVWGFINNSSGKDALGLLDGGCLNVAGYTASQVSCVAVGSTVYRATTAGQPIYSQPVTN